MEVENHGNHFLNYHAGRMFPVRLHVYRCLVPRAHGTYVIYPKQLDMVHLWAPTACELDTVNGYVRAVYGRVSWVVPRNSMVNVQAGVLFQVARE